MSTISGAKAKQSGWQKLTAEWATTEFYTEYFHTFDNQDCHKHINFHSAESFPRRRRQQQQQQQQQQQHSFFSQISWDRLEMKPERNKFKVQAH